MIAPRVKNGQVYRDVDPRADGRLLTVVCRDAVQKDRIVCRSQKNGRLVRIASKRLRDLKLYVLVSDS